MPKFHLITEKHSKTSGWKICQKILQLFLPAYRKVQEKITWTDALKVDFSRFLLMRQYLRLLQLQLSSAPIFLKAKRYICVFSSGLTACTIVWSSQSFNQIYTTTAFKWTSFSQTKQAKFVTIFNKFSSSLTAFTIVWSTSLLQPQLSSAPIFLKPNFYRFSNGLTACTVA